MKFQHLILPLVLWLSVGLFFVYFVPTTPLIIGGMILLITLATYFSARVVTHGKLSIIITCGVSVFLLSSVLSGFNPINLLLIAAISTLISLLIKNK